MEKESTGFGSRRGKDCDLKEDWSKKFYDVIVPYILNYRYIKLYAESEEFDMEYRCKVTVLDKKLYPELQQQYCAVPNSGKCACYNVGDEFMFYRNDERDDYWHMGAGTLVKSGQPDEGVLISPGTMHCGVEGVPFCSEAWDAISRYIYTALQEEASCMAG